jgi:acylaminoacyl-peptidase
MDVADDAILFTASSINQPPRLGLYRVSSMEVFAGTASSCVAARFAASSDRPALGSNILEQLANVQWKIFSLESDDGLVYEYTMILPGSRAGAPSSLPLICVPHGGPHSVLTTAFSAPYAFLALHLQSIVIYVNYRGSTGFGQASIDSLPGNIGKHDVLDCISAIEHAKSLTFRGCFGYDSDAPLVAAEKISVCGGSHGGFLTAHLIEQYPSLFKAAAMRNPVTNIPAMVTVSDIPDWCVVESGFAYDFDTFSVPSEEVLVAMRRCSPVRYVDQVVAPTLICLGKKLTSLDERRSLLTALSDCLE